MKFLHFQTFQQYFSCITARRHNGADHNKNSTERGTAPVRTCVVYIVWFFLIAESIPGFLLNEPAHDKTNKMACAPSEDRTAWASTQSDQSLLCTQWVAQDPSFLHVDSKDWSDWSDAQADLSLRWAHMPFCWFCHVLAQIYMRVIVSEA